MNYWAVLLTGLTVGGLSCMAVQGGLLASVVGARRRSVPQAFLATFLFLTAKLVVYTILGFALGSLGESLALPLPVVVGLQFFAGFYMIATALNLMNVHPVFRRVVIQPPPFFRRLVRGQAKSEAFFAPVFLGLATVLIPCGTTISMEALAVTTSSGFSGALTMAVFTLGTFPLFLGLGVFAGTVGKVSNSKFSWVAASLLVYLGLSSINGALVLGGSPFSFRNVQGRVVGLWQIVLNPAGDGSRVLAGESGGVQTVNGVQNAEINVYSTRYDPKYLEVKVGMPVRLDLTARGALGCTSVFVIPSLGITRSLANGVASVEFTPKKTGEILWTCSMGMYTGTIRVVANNG